jgi:hypothetical protein
MCRLIIGTPSSHCISNVSASEFDLCVIAHDAGAVFAGTSDLELRIAGGCKEGVSGAG